MNKSVCIINGDRNYEAMFKSLGYVVVDSIEEATLVCFTGGSDVSPELYGERNVKSYCNANRDDFEQKIFDQCYKLNTPMVGICRGGQFLNVMNGGKMWQHVNAHTHNHYVRDVETGELFLCSSTHHQMMRPASNGVLVGLAASPQADVFVNDSGIYHRDVQSDDIEVVWYEETQSLCFQPHPEFSGYAQCTAYFEELLKRYDL